MKKALEITGDIVREISHLIEGEGVRSFDLRSIRMDKEDSFFIKYAAGSVDFEASNAVSAIFGASLVKAGMRSGYLPECLGQSRACYSLRPLWLTSDRHVSVSEKLGLYLPAFLLEKGDSCFEIFCRRVLELGFNAVVFGSKGIAFAPKSTHPFKELKSLVDKFHSYGIKVIIKPVSYFQPKDETLYLTPCDDGFTKKVQEALGDLFSVVPNLDMLFWESHYCHPDFQHHPTGSEWTKEDKTRAEMQLVESLIPKESGLIFYLATDSEKRALEQTAWLPSLIDDAAASTTIAFTLYCGDPLKETSISHPIWELLRKRLDVSATRLLPILNIGSVGQGDGLWPNIPLDSLEDFKRKAERHRFSGMISLIPHLPKKGSLLDCSLFVTGQFLWRQSTPHCAAETWFAVNMPEIDHSKIIGILRLSRFVIKKLTVLSTLALEKSRDTLSSEECRAIADCVLGVLKEIEYARGKCDHELLKSYFNFFVRDARRIVYHGLLCSGLPPSSLDSDSLKEGFWTAISESGGDGLRSTAKVTLLKTPDIGEPGTARHKIYWNSRIDV